VVPRCQNGRTRLATKTSGLPGSGSEPLRRAATDILVLARKGRAFGSLDTLIARQGGKHVLYGSALTLAAAVQTWAVDSNTPLHDLAWATVR
jgi:hypothetical protein